MKTWPHLVTPGASILSSQHLSTKLVNKMPSVSHLPSTDTQVSKILSIISAYRHRSVNVPDRFAKFVPQLQKRLTDTVSKKEPVRFILPAFPFKAPAEDIKSKTLGSLPDKAEEIALQTLDGFADSIAEIYEGGANVVIVSDASVYGGAKSIVFLGKLSCR